MIARLLDILRNRYLGLQIWALVIFLICDAFGYGIGLWRAVFGTGRLQFTAPRSQMDQHFANKHAAWLKAFNTAPRAPHGLPIADIADVFDRPGTSLRRPARDRVDGNRLTLVIAGDSTRILYQLKPIQALLIASPRPLASFKVTYRTQTIHDRFHDVNDAGYLLPFSAIPSEFFTDAPGLRHLTLWVYDREKRPVNFYVLRLPDSAEILALKGQP